MEASEPVPSSAPKRSPAPHVVAITLLVCLLVYLAAGFPIANTGAVISPDCGARLLQVQALREHWPDWSIPYPAAALDPGHQNSPLTFYEFLHNGKTYTFYSFLFAMISAKLSQWFGPVGMILLPLFCGLAAGVAAYAVARRLGLRYPLAALVLVTLLTPTLHFSVVFWDPAVMTGFGAVCLYLAIRGIQDRQPLWWLAAGVVLGAGFWLHEIILAYLPALVAGAVYIYRRRALGPVALLVGGVVALLIPLALINHAVYGTYAGPHLANNHLSSPGDAVKLLADPTLWGPAAFYTLFGWGDSNPGYSWLLKEWLQSSDRVRWEYGVSMVMSIPVILWIILALTGLWRRKWMWIAALVLFAGLLEDGNWVLSHNDLPHSLFYVCPILALAFAGGRSRKTGEDVAADGANRSLWWFVGIVTGTFTVLELLTPPLGGTEWGSRYLMIPVPALVLFACRAVEGQVEAALTEGTAAERGPAYALLTGMGALILMTAALQVVGYVKILDIHRWNQQLSADVLARPQTVVVSTSWWAPLNAAPAYPKKQILFAGDRDHPATPLFVRLRMNGIREFLLLGDPRNLSGDMRPMGYAPDVSTARRTSFGMWLCKYGLPEGATVVQPPTTARPSDPSIPPPVNLHPH